MLQFKYSSLGSCTMSEGQLFELEEDEELRVEVDCAKVR